MDMNLEQIMQFNNFVVVGDTLNPEKYAYKIKKALLENGYNACGVGKEKESLNDVEYDIEVVDLCIHPAKGIKLLKECLKNYKVVLIQPGAESEEIISYLKSVDKPFIEGCALVGVKLYKKEK